MARQAHKSKSRKPQKQPSGKGAMSGPARRRLPRWAIILLTIAVVAGATIAALEFILPGQVPQQLVGKWQVVGGDMSGATMEFRRDGSMIGHVAVNGTDRLLEGKARVIGQTLETTTQNPFTGKAETGTQTIVTLTETDFVTQDAKGTTITMKRHH